MRMNGTTKAPIVNNFGETISGAMTIRAFEKIPQFQRKNLELVDTDASLFFHTFIAYEWLVLRLETLCAIIVATSALLMVLLPSEDVNGGEFFHMDESIGRNVMLQQQHHLIKSGLHWKRDIWLIFNAWYKLKLHIVPSSVAFWWHYTQDVEANILGVNVK